MILELVALFTNMTVDRIVDSVVDNVVDRVVDNVVGNMKNIGTDSINPEIMIGDCFRTYRKPTKKKRVSFGVVKKNITC